MRFHVALMCVDGVGPVAAAKVLEAFPDAEAAFGAGAERLMGLGLSARQARAVGSFSDFAAADCVIEAAQRDGQRIVVYTGEDYPPALRTIHTPPPVLFVKGELGAKAELAVCVVGTRNPTAYGEETARRLGAALGRSAIATVSGGARGIDSLVHRGSLDAQGVTVAVLGCGLDIAYPPENRALFEQILAAGGALVGELPPGARPDAGTFPRRNRILAGLGRACVVVEAGERSGALITARFAMEQGKTVLAVPGRIDHAQSRGANRLIRDGAKPVLEVMDVVEEVVGEHVRRSAAEEEWFAATPNRRPQPTGDAGRLWAVLMRGEAQVDEIVRETGLTSAQVGTTLIELELAGRVRRLPGNRYAIVSEDG